MKPVVLRSSLSLRILASSLLGLCAVSCDDSGPSARGEATIDGVVTTFPVSVRASKQLSQLDIAVDTRDGKEHLSIIVAFGEETTIDCDTGPGLIHASVHYVGSDGNNYGGALHPNVGCYVDVIDDVNDGDGLVTLGFGGTLSDGTDSVTITNGSITVRGLD